MPLDLSVLRTELQTDPNGYGYAEWVQDGSDQALADLLNHVRDGVTPARDDKPAGLAILVDRDDVTPDEVLLAVSPTALATAPQTMVQVMMLRPQVSAALVRKVFPYLKITTRHGSRAEQLFGTGTALGHLDIAHALGRGM